MTRRPSSASSASSSASSAPPSASGAAPRAPLVLAPPEDTGPAAPPARRRCALGTTFLAGGGAAQGARPETRVLHGAEALGAEALHLCAGLPADLLSALAPELVVRRAELPVLALDGVLGAERLGRPRAARAGLAALERDEAAAAVEVVQAALGFAAELGAPYVLISLGAVAGLAPLWDELRGRFLRGELLADDGAAEALMTARAGLAVRHLDAARRSLDKLAELAARTGTTVLVRNPRRAIELPTPIELRTLTAGLRGAPLAPVLDAPAAHLGSVMHLVPLRETLLSFGTGPLALLGDACGAVGALPPGRGELDVAAVARLLAPGAQRSFVPWTGLRRAEIAAGYRAVAAL